jgi:lipopolysaccharide/colanic/teichoic acid biosynthesis glycosyltransferase
MVLKSWDDLPENMKNDSVKRYYGILEKKRTSFIMKRLFDFFVAIITLVILLPLFLLISIAIKIDSKGPVMYVRYSAALERIAISFFFFTRSLPSAFDLVGQLVSY